MRWISKIQLINFRTHRNRTIRLSPRVTCITGDSDHGKSNVIRGFRWAALNRPTGVGFIRWGKRQAKVRISILGHVACRIRGKKRNVYRLDRESFEAFGNGVPEPIARLLRMADINFQLQHEPHFWFNLTAGEVSRQLNKIVNLDVIDKTLANLNAKVTKAKSVVDVTKDRLKEAQEQRKQLRYAKEMRRDYDHLIRLQKRMNRLERRVGTLGMLIETARECEERVHETKGIAEEARRDLNALKIMRDRFLAVTKDQFTLSDAIQDVEVATNQLAISSKRLREAKRELDQVRGNRCPLCNQPTQRK